MSGSSPTSADPVFATDLVREVLENVPRTLTIIEPKPGWRLVNVQELWRYRELVLFLIWRDIKVRYKQTALGAAWAVLQPFATMVVFSLFLGRLVDGIAGTAPYPIFVFAGLLPWGYLANTIGSAGTSVVGNQNLVTKIYFPRLIIPASAAGAGLVDFAIAFGMLMVLMIYYSVVPGPSFLLLPIILLLLVTAALGIGILLSALTVAYRDFRYVIPFMVQLWMFATPAIYLPAENISAKWQTLLPLNPAHGLILNFRAAALGMPMDFYALGVSGTVGVACLIAGCLYFRRVELSFADII